MAPPTTAPRLRMLDPPELARTTAQMALDRIAVLARDVAGVARIRALAPERTSVYRAVLELGQYARGELELEGSVRDRLVVLAPLYGSVLADPPDADDLEADPMTPLGLVICGARARERLAGGHGLTTAELAVLGGISQNACALLIRQREIAAERREDGAWMVPPREARRWLRARGAA